MAKKEATLGISKARQGILDFTSKSPGIRFVNDEVKIVESTGILVDPKT